MEMKHFSLLILVTVGCIGCAKAPEANQSSWETMTIQKGAYTLPSYFSAKISGKEDARIFPQVNGTIIEKCVSQGQRVSRGQVLFKIDPIPFRLSVESAEADLATAKANRSTAKLNYESTQTLYDKNIVSRYVLDKASNDYESAKANVKVAIARVDLARNDLNHCSVTSPVDGIVGAINYNVGDLVGSTMTNPYTTVSDNHIAVVAFSLNESQYTELLSIRSSLFGGNVDKVLSQLPDVNLKLKDGRIYGHTGRIVSIAGVVDEMTGSVICKAEFPNPEGILASGISGSLVFPCQYDSVIVIPKTAVNTLQDKMLAYVVQPDSTVRCTVIQAESVDDGKQLIVTDGLTDGDEIVTLGVAALIDGQKVKF